MRRTVVVTAGAALACALGAAPASAAWRSYEVAHPAGTAGLWVTQSAGPSGQGNAIAAEVRSDDGAGDASLAVFVEQSHFEDDGYEADRLDVLVSTPAGTVAADQDAERAGSDRGRSSDAEVLGTVAAGEYSYAQGDQRTCAHYVQVIDRYESAGCPTGDALVPVAPTAPTLPDVVALLP